jgi:hypothetical protein
MAFGKKKEEGAQPADDLATAFAPPEGEAAEDEAAAPELPANVQTVEAAPEEEPPPPAPDDADALLSVFQTSDGEEDDRTVLLELAGEVDIAGLLEDLRTIRSALNRTTRLRAAA